MDRQQFLEKILPDGGNYILLDLGGNRPVQRHTDDRRKLVGIIEHLQRNPNNNIYFSCASFTGKKRTQEEAAFARSLWVDVDVDPDKPAKAYPDKKAAAQAIVQAVKDTGMPQPLVVMSGRGYHLYWPFTEDVTIQQWQPVAEALKKALRAVKFKQDPVATADSARILRPVDTVNPKNGALVKVVRDNGPYEFDALAAILTAYVADLDEGEIDLREHASSGMFDDEMDLSVTNYPKASGHVVRTKCIALNAIATEPDKASEPEWRGMLGLTKYCIEGDALAHEWSKGHPDYNEGETQTKLDNWATPPTTCQYFDDLDMCGGCRFKSPALKSPILLGVEDTIEVTTGPKALATTTKVTIPWPFGWDKEKRKLYRKVKNDEGVVEKRVFCSSLFVVRTRIRSTEGPWEMLCARQKYTDPNGIEPDEWEEFRVPNKSIGRSSDLSAALASYEVYGMGKNGSGDLVDLFKAYGDQLRDAKEETLSYRAFGFDGQRNQIVETSHKFVVGTRAIDEAGEWEDVLCSDHVPSIWQQEFGQAGTWEDWSELVDKVYNEPGAEALQFAICCGFAAPLTPLLSADWWHGCAVAYVSTTGYGKSTVAKVACSIYGKGSLFEIAADRQSGATVQAQLQKLAVARHLPLLFDETSVLTTEEMVQMLYAMSTGKDKERLDVTGKPKAGEGYWDTISFVTTNKSLIELLSRAQNHGVQEATMVRMYEIRLEEYIAKSFFSDERKHILDVELPKHYGAAGERWLPFVLKNIDKIDYGVRKIQKELSGGRDMIGDSAERFQHQLIASALFAGRAAKRLGLVNFDMDRVRDWALRNLNSQREERGTLSMNAIELVSIYLTAEHEGMIKSRYYHKSGKTPNNKMQEVQVRGDVLGRIVTHDKQIFISSPPFRKWIGERGLSAKAIYEELFTCRALKTPTAVHVNSPIRDFEQMMTLGKGTNITTGQHWCIELDFNMIAKESPVHVIHESQEQTDGSKTQQP